jgi:hypothetical protein
MLRREHLAIGAVLCLVISALSCTAERPAQVAEEPARTVEAPAADPADVESIDAILAAAYDVISGPAGDARDWDRMRSLFIPEARLISAGPDSVDQVVPHTLDVEGFIATASPYFEENGFFEYGIAERTERYGHIAHVFSTYEARQSASDPEPFARGINSFQLLDDGERWWIVTLYWENESPEFPIPEEYLPEEGQWY